MDICKKLVKIAYDRNAERNDQTRLTSLLEGSVSYSLPLVYKLPSDPES